MRHLVSSARKASGDEVQEEAKRLRRPTHRQTRQRSGPMTISRIGGRTTKQRRRSTRGSSRSEEHTSELQSRLHLVCRLLLEKKKKTKEKNVNKTKEQLHEQ